MLNVGYALGNTRHSYPRNIHRTKVPLTILLYLQPKTVSLTRKKDELAWINIISLFHICSLEALLGSIPNQFL